MPQKTAHGKKRLCQVIKTKADGLSGEILSRIELMIPHEDGRLKTLRGQVLTVINDKVREIETEIDRNYEVKDLRSNTFTINTGEREVK
jgi:hypothetical protein